MRISIPASVTIISLLFVSVCFAQSKSRLDAYGQPLPDGAIARLGRLKFGMLGSPVAAAWSPDGKTIAAVNNDKPHLIIWEWPSGKVLKEERLPQANWSRLLFSPDGKYLFWNDGYGNQQSISRLWNVEKGVHISVPTALHALARSAAFSSDGKRLALAVPGQGIFEWIIGETRVTSHGGIRAPDLGVKYSSRNELIVAAGDKDSVTVLNLATGKQLLRATEPDLRYRPFAFSPDGKWLAFQRDRNHVVVREIEGKREWLAPIDKQDIMANLTFTSDSKTAVVTMIGRMSQIDLETGKLLMDKRQAMYIDAMFSPDGKTFATFGPNHVYALLFYDARTGKQFETSVGHQYPVYDIFWTPNGKEVVTSAFSALHFWDPRTGRLIRIFRPEDDRVGLTRSFDNRWIITSPNGPTGKLHALDMTTFQHVCDFPNLIPNSWCRVSISSDTRLIAIGLRDPKPNQVMLWDLASQKPLWPEPQGFESVESLELLPGDDGVLVVANRGVWVIERGRNGEIARRQLLDTNNPRISLSWDHRFVICSDLDFPGFQKPRIVEIATGTDLIQLSDDIVAHVYLSHDMRTCAAIEKDGRPHLFDLLSGKPLATIDAGLFGTWRFSPDDRLLICPGKGLDACTPLVWDVEKWTHRKRDGSNSATKTEVKTWCEQLRDPKATVGMRAVWKLADHPKLAVPSLQNIFGKSPKPDPTRIARLISQLDDRKFAVREAAQRELIISGSVARDAIEQAIWTNATPEHLARLKSLLARIKETADSERVFASRSVLALEIAGTIEAKALLEDAAKRVPANRVAIEARRALSRWHDRP